MKNELWIYAGFLAVVIVVAWAFGFKFDETFTPSISVYTDGRNDPLK